MTMDDHKRRQDSIVDFEIDLSIFRKFISSIPVGLAFHKIILDQDKKPIDYVFLEVNDAFETQTQLKRVDILNKRITEVLPRIKNDPANWIQRYGEVAITGVGKSFEGYSKQLKKWYRVIATCPQKGFFMVIFEDITNQRKIEKEREELIAELREAISEIKQLRGILPICASCKKIRDDKGAWEQIEIYIHNHSELDFSHSICPECVKKLYPGYNISE